jgi:hypothetical protein
MAHKGGLLTVDICKLVFTGESYIQLQQKLDLVVFWPGLA